MGKKIFISYKYADTSVQHLARTPYLEQTKVRDYIDEIQKRLEEGDHINKGEKDGEDLSNFKDETIESKLRDKIYDSSVTIVLISPRMRSDSIPEEDQWIPWEISYSLKEVTRADKTSRTNAILGVVLPDVNGSCEYILTKRTCCPNGCTFFNTVNLFKIIKKNTFNRKHPDKYDCVQRGIIQKWPYSYIHIVSWDDFINDMDTAINNAISIRERIADFEIRKEIE